MGRSCQEIANELGLSRQRIQQLEQNAMAKLRALAWASEDFPMMRAVFAHDLEKAEALVTRDKAFYKNRVSSRNEARHRQAREKREGREA